MAALKAIKTKIRSIEKTQKVTKAMEAVSASKMRKAQARAIAGRSFARAAAAILARVSGSRELANHPLSEARTVARALYLVITSDKGLAGALNSAVLRAVAADVAQKGLTPAHVSIIAVGRKANDFFTSRGYTVEVYHPNTDAIDAALVRELVDEAALRFVNKETDIVHIVYQNLISTFEQRPTIRTMFPLSLGELEAVVHDIVPARGVFSKPTNGEVRPQSYTIEPTEHEVLAAILPRLASIFVYHALLESQASEHSARMVSMKSASDKAGELTDKFTLQFNKARQAAITREVSEITGGMEAMAG
jgi:F-type H+-transporting ATPase subunit gamma